MNAFSFVCPRLGSCHACRSLHGHTLNIKLSISQLKAASNDTHLQELVHKVRGLVSSLDVVLLREVLEELGLLLPEVDALLVLHVALGVQHVLDGQVVDKSVSLKLLSNLGSDGGDGELDLVQIGKGGGTSQELSVQSQGSLLELLLGSRKLDGLGKGGSDDGHCVWCSFFQRSVPDAV